MSQSPESLQLEGSKDNEKPDRQELSPSCRNGISANQEIKRASCVQGFLLVVHRDHSQCRGDIRKDFNLCSISLTPYSFYNLFYKIVIAENILLKLNIIIKCLHIYLSKILVISYFCIILFYFFLHLHMIN